MKLTLPGLALALLTASCASDDSNPDSPTPTGTKQSASGMTAPDQNTTPDPEPDQAAGVTTSGAAKKYTTEDFRKAKQQQQTFCINCHGRYGKGDGLSAAALNPKPRDWTDAKWHDSVTDEQIFKVIRDGGAKHGLSPSMAPNPMYGDQPGVLHALVKIVRKFKGK